MMFIEIILTYQQITPRLVKDKICVVIDTLRATSTIIAALNSGCREIVPAFNLQEALKLKEEKYQDYLLGGELLGKFPQNFHLGNSPLEYSNGILKDKGLIFTTTNGTRALRKLKGEGAEKILICALLNARWVGKWLSRQKKDVLICCAGTRGKYSLEDYFTAGRLIKDLKESKNNFSFSDAALGALHLYNHIAGQSEKREKAIVEAFKASANGQRLLKAGGEADIYFCSREDLYPLLPFYINGSIKVKNQNPEFYKEA